MQCAAHPSVETELACGKCGKAICVRCLYHTPVGGRCRPCANIRAIPIYQIPPLYVARGLGASIAAGMAFGALWGFLLPFGDAFFVVLVGLALGFCVGEATSIATNRKAGPPLQAAAVGGVLIAYLVRVLMYAVIEDLPLLEIVREDTYGFLVIAFGGVIAASRLR